MVTLYNATGVNPEIAQTIATSLISTELEFSIARLVLSCVLGQIVELNLAISSSVGENGITRDITI